MFAINEPNYIILQKLMFQNKIIVVFEHSDTSPINIMHYLAQFTVRISKINSPEKKLLTGQTRSNFKNNAISLCK